MDRYKYFLLGLFSFAFLLSLHANNDSVRIEVTAKQIKEKKILLCSFFNGQVYVKDSLYLSSDGTGAFHKAEKYPEGEYFLHLLIDTVKTYEKSINFLLADEQKFSITLDTTDLVNKSQISGAKQSEALFNYLVFLQAKQKERSQLMDGFSAFPESRRDTTQVKLQLEILDKEVKFYQENLINEYKGKWVASFLRGVEPVTTGPYPVPTSKEEYEKEFRYRKNHYFDNIDLQDSRFWWTSFFPQKVIEYIEKQVEPNPDSLADATSQLVEKTKGDSVCFRLMLNKLVNYSLSSNKMGMENIWMKLVEDYYHKGLVTWADSAHLEAMETEYQWLNNNRIGLTAQDLDLRDITGKSVKLHQLGEKYTLFYLYEPSCGHCIEMTPELYEKIYKKYAGKGLDIVAMCIVQIEKEWTDFIEENHLRGDHWHNVWDPSADSAFWLYYDIRTTPGVYLLDENKKIIAKKIDIETMDSILDSLLSELNN